MNECQTCSWFRVKNTLPFCVEVRAKGDNVCDRFYGLEDLGRVRVWPKEETKINAKCTCGVDAYGGGIHSSWCNKG